VDAKARPGPRSSVQRVLEVVDVRVKPHGDKVRGALGAAHVAPAHKAPRGRAAGDRCGGGGGDDGFHAVKLNPIS
jgi:hypothetical protein